MTDDHAPGPMAIICPDCDAPVLCRPHGYTLGQDEDGPPERWTLLQCPNYHTLLVLQNEYGGGHKFDDDEPYRMYPPQDLHLSNEIP
jgi:hypothetical protein